MKVFVWERIRGITDNYHDGGGLMILHTSLTSARRLWQKHREEYQGEFAAEFGSDPGTGLKTDELIEELPSPDMVFTIIKDGVEPKIVKFPDAGCC